MARYSANGMRQAKKGLDAARMIISPGRVISSTQEGRHVPARQTLAEPDRLGIGYLELQLGWLRAAAPGTPRAWPRRAIGAAICITSGVCRAQVPWNYTAIGRSVSNFIQTAIERLAHTCTAWSVTSAPPPEQRGLPLTPQ